MKVVVNVQGRKDEDLDPGSGDEDGENSLRGRMGMVKCWGQVSAERRVVPLVGV